jgi:Spherulation-specific family 4
MTLYNFIENGKSLSLYFGLASLLFFISFFTFSNSVYASPQTTGTIIPLYANPGSEWEKVINAKKTHPSVPTLVIVNPNNGPMSCPRQDYVKGITDLKSVGIVTLGYVSTNYTARENKEIITDIDNWKICYPNIDGIFFDEMANIPGKENYYANLTSYAKSKGFVFTMGNPGIEPLTSYVGTVDNLVIYEDVGLPNPSLLERLCEKFNKSNISIISYGIKSLNYSTIRYISPHVGYLFITNGTLPNPFTSLPLYFDQIFEQLDKNNHEKKDDYKELSTSKLEHRYVHAFKKFVYK